MIDAGRAMVDELASEPSAPTLGRRHDRPVPHVAMVLYGDLTYDSRVRREAAALARAGYRVSVVCLADESDGSDLSGVDVLVRPGQQRNARPGHDNPYHAASRKGIGRMVARLKWLWRYARGVREWGRVAATAVGVVDAWHAHDLPGLVAVAAAVERTTPIVYDTHELFVDSGTARQMSEPFRALLRLYEKRLVRRTAAVVTVNDALARMLERRYHPRRTCVVYNCPDPRPAAAGPDEALRQAAGIGSDDRLILYHGQIGSGRGIEQLIAVLAMPELRGTHLALLGSGVGKPRFASLAAALGPASHVHMIDAVPPEHLLDWVSSADLGAVLIQPSTLNHYLSTPNKLFECLAAGVPVVASDFPMMRQIVMEDPLGRLGTVCDPVDPTKIAAAIRSILDLGPQASAELRARCLEAAVLRWNWASESAKLVDLYRDLAPVNEVAFPSRHL